MKRWAKKQQKAANLGRKGTSCLKDEQGRGVQNFDGDEEGRC